MSSNDTSGDLTLEDINTGEKFILRHTEQLYRCGRKKTNHIVSESILASREHCIFLRNGAEINMIPSESANGTYLNGVAQQPKLMVTLKINDVIGLGSPSMVPQSRPGLTTPTIYVLKVFQQELPSPPESENQNSILTPPLINEAGTSTAENKRRLSKDSNDCGVPCKIPKMEEKIPITIVENKNRNARGSTDSSVPIKDSKDQRKSQLPDIIDITDENNSNDEMKLATSNKSHNLEKGKKIINHPVNSLNKVKYPKNDAMPNSKDMSRSMLMDDDTTNVAGVSPTCSPRHEIENTTKSNRNQCRPSVISIANRFKTKKRDDDKDERVRSSTIAEKSTSGKDVISKREQRRNRESSGDKIVPISEKSFSCRSKIATHVDAASKSNEQIVPTRSESEETSSSGEDEEISRYENSFERRNENTSRKESEDDDFTDFLVPAFNLDDLNLHERMHCDAEKKDTEVDHSRKGYLVQSNDNGVVQWIKYEPELMIVDDDESVYENTKYTSEITAPTPLKLKRVKQETKTRYSVIDTVTLSDDDEDDFFPASQLFGDEPEDNSKLLPLNKDTEENEPEMFTDERNDDPDIILLMDSEDEDGSLYNRVMQSSLNESRDFYVKREPEEQHNLRDYRQDDNFGIVDEQQEMSNLCFPGNRDETKGTINDEDKREKKKKRSKSVEKLKKTRLNVLEELKKLDESEERLLEIMEESNKLKKSDKRVEESMVQKLFTELVGSDKEREDTLDENIIIDEAKRERKKKRSNSAEKLEKARLRLLEESNERILEKTKDLKKLRKSEELEKLKKSDKRVEESTVKKLYTEIVGKDKEREDTPDEQIITDDAKRERKKKRSNSDEKLEKTRMSLSEESDERILEKTRDLKKLRESGESEKLKKLKISEKRVDESAMKKCIHEDRSRDKEREDTPSKTDKRRDSNEKKAHDGKSSRRSKDKSIDKIRETEDVVTRKESSHKTKSKKHDKERISVDSKSSRISDDVDGRIDSEDGKSNEKNFEKSLARSTEKPRSIFAEKSRSISTENTRSVSTKKSKSISTEKTRSISTEEPEKISTERSRSINAEKSRSASTENSKTISNERSQSISTKRSPSISNDSARPITKEDSRLKTIESPFVILTKLDQARKSLQIVEAPFLAKGERRSVSCSVKKIDASTDREEASTSGVRQISRINGHDVGSTNETTTESDGKSASKGLEKKLNTKDNGRKLTTKQKKELAIKEKQQEFERMKEQKRRRMKNKWADCIPLRNHQGPSLTREEKEEIKNDRKEKLKRIADEKKKAAENNGTAGIKRPVTKAIVKVTEKTRSDYLVNEMEEQITKQSINFEDTLLVNGVVESSVSSEKPPDESSMMTSEKLTNGNEMSRTNDVKSSKEKKRKDKSLDVIIDNHRNGGETSVNSFDKSARVTRRRDESLDVENVNPDNDKANLTTSVINKVSQQLKTLLVIEPRNHEYLQRNTKEKSRAKATATRTERLAGKSFNNVTSESSSTTRDPRSKVGSSLESLSRKNSSGSTTREALCAKVIKRVSFNDLMTKVKVFEIEPGNTMKKCPTTDAPVQAKRALNRRTLDRTACPKLEQFLLRIFGWNPAWLQEQKQLDIPPPIVDEKTLMPMLLKYETYEDYYKVTEPLLALELWYQISRDTDITEKNSNRSPVMSSIVNNSISLTTIPSTNIRLTTLMLEVVVSRRELDLQTCPAYGDLVFFEYKQNATGKKSFATVFAYVEKIRQTIITPFTHYNRDLLNYVKDPYVVMSYSVVTKPLDCTNIQTNRVYRLRRISYLRSNMRMIQALQYLPVSPLMNQILHPKIDEYKMLEVQSTTPYSLVTKDHLNAKQLEAVIRVTDTVVRKEPKICLIQGPPGTGKSKVIVNLVTEILYGGGRYSKNKKMRILVCAPSNAAIDEIVQRLLVVRQSIPETTGRFKMVRIGRVETMHPLAKNISLKVLAKKDVKTTTENYMSPAFTVDSVEEEKRLLVAKINSQQLELSAAQCRNALDVNYLAKTLCESKSRLDLLTNRRPLERIDPKELAKLERGAETTLLMGADVITCTLATCYTSLMESLFAESGQEISVCIVDEATQCAEAETLIPLMLGVKTLVLVGDTNQLPATIISQKAKKFGLDQSLFARIQNSFAGMENTPIIKLDTQYRMVWPVARWPNKYFYAGGLKNAANMRNLPFQFYKVINLDSKQNNDKFSNTDEATFVANLLYTMMACSKLDDTYLPVRVGIITPYNNQKMLIKSKIRECITPLPENVKSRMVHEVNTVDSFQGQERDVIIMSCVRSHGIGFLSDRQRLCVALTRAKHSLILCGNFETFERDPMWNALLADARNREVYTHVKATASPDVIKRHIFR